MAASTKDSAAAVEAVAMVAGRGARGGKTEDKEVGVGRWRSGLLTLCTEMQPFD